MPLSSSFWSLRQVCSPRLSSSNRGLLCFCLVQRACLTLSCADKCKKPDRRSDSGETLPPPEHHHSNTAVNDVAHPATSLATNKWSVSCAWVRFAILSVNKRRICTPCFFFTEPFACKNCTKILTSIYGFGSQGTRPVLLVQASQKLQALETNTQLGFAEIQNH